MMGGFAKGRRADEFDALLSQPAGHEQVDGEYAELLAVVASLRAVPEVTARPEFVADLRERLVAEAERRPVRVVDDATVAKLTPKQRRGGSERRLATVLGGFAVVAASGSMAMASQGALPGDVLYPMKRAIENAETNLQSDDSGKAASLIDHAERRLGEVQALNAADSDNASQIAATLDDFTQQSRQAAELVLDDYDQNGDAAAVADLREFAASAMAALSALGEDLPAEARPALITAAQTLAQIDAEAFQTCPSCGDGPVTQLPQFEFQSLPLLLDTNTDFEASATSTPPANYEKLLQEVREQAQNVPVESEAPETEEPVGVPGTDGSDGAVDNITDGVDDLLTGDDDTSGDDGSGGDDKNSDKDTDKGVTDVAVGVVDGVTGLVNGLLD